MQSNLQPLLRRVRLFGALIIAGLFAALVAVTPADESERDRGETRPASEVATHRGSPFNVEYHTDGNLRIVQFWVGAGSIIPGAEYVLQVGEEVLARKMYIENGDAASPTGNVGAVVLTLGSGVVYTYKLDAPGRQEVTFDPPLPVRQNMRVRFAAMTNNDADSLLQIAFHGSPIPTSGLTVK